MKTELKKTLKNMRFRKEDINICCAEKLARAEIEIKTGVIKWIKEDYELVTDLSSHKMLERWKNRFNITEEDLKNEK